MNEIVTISTPIQGVSGMETNTDDSGSKDDPAERRNTTRHFCPPIA